MSNPDYFMRQIEGMTDMLSVMMFGEKLARDDDVIYDTQASMAGHGLLIDLRFLFVQGKLNEAENLLFRRMETDKDASYLEVSREFYGWLEKLSDEELEKADYTRAEISEGRDAAAELLKSGGGVA